MTATEIELSLKHADKHILMFRDFRALDAIKAIELRERRRRLLRKRIERWRSRLKAFWVWYKLHAGIATYMLAIWFIPLYKALFLAFAAMLIRYALRRPGR